MKFLFAALTALAVIGLTACGSGELNVEIENNGTTQDSNVELDPDGDIKIETDKGDISADENGVSIESDEGSLEVDNEVDSKTETDKGDVSADENGVSIESDEGSVEVDNEGDVKIIE